MNNQVHLDIESDIEKIKDGQFTFILRINNGQVVDYNRIVYVDAKKYGKLEQKIMEEFTAAYGSGTGSNGNTVRSDNFQREDQKRDS